MSHARMMTGRSQDTPITSLELRHANRTLLHDHAQQGQLQLDTPVPRHPLPHELNLGHEIRRIPGRIYTRTRNIFVTVTV